MNSSKPRDRPLERGVRAASDMPARAVLQATCCRACSAASASAAERRAAARAADATAAAWRAAPARRRKSASDPYCSSWRGCGLRCSECIVSALHLFPSEKRLRVRAC